MSFASVIHCWNPSSSTRWKFTMVCELPFCIALDLPTKGAAKWLAVRCVRTDVKSSKQPVSPCLQIPTSQTEGTPLSGFVRCCRSIRIRLTGRRVSGNHRARGNPEIANKCENDATTLGLTDNSVEAVSRLAKPFRLRRRIIACTAVFWQSIQYQLRPHASGHILTMSLHPR